MTAAEKLNGYLNGDRLHIRYTLLSDDITKGEAPFGMPYRDRKGYFDGEGRCEEAKADITVSDFDGGIKIELTTQSEELSEFGLSFPFNFMGKKDGGGWQNQYLLNSPYTSEGNAYKYCYLTNPNGKNLIVFSKGNCDGWKCDYSSEVCPGHFFLELEFLANFDRAYHTGSCNRRLELYLFEVGSFEDAVDKVCNTLETCALTYEKSFVKIGETITLNVHGNCGEVRCGGKSYRPKNGTVKALAEEYGLISAVPYCKGERGMEATFYAYDDIAACYKRAMNSVSKEDLSYTDENLCEHQCWESAMLRYMARYGQRAEYWDKLIPALEVITEKDEQKAIPRRTIFYREHKGAPPYSIFESGRSYHTFRRISLDGRERIFEISHGRARLRFGTSFRLRYDLHRISQRRERGLYHGVLFDYPVRRCGLDVTGRGSRGCEKIPRGGGGDCRISLPQRKFSYRGVCFRQDGSGNGGRFDFLHRIITVILLRED